MLAEPRVAGQNGRLPAPEPLLEEVAESAPLGGLLGEPLPVWVSIPVPLLFTAALLAFAAWKVRRTEVDYGIE